MPFKNAGAVVQGVARDVKGGLVPRHHRAVSPNKLGRHRHQVFSGWFSRSSTFAYHNGETIELNNVYERGSAERCKGSIWRGNYVDRIDFGSGGEKHYSKRARSLGTYDSALFKGELLEIL